MVHLHHRARIIVAFLFAAAVATACGEAPNELLVRVALPWQAPLATCDERVAIGVDLEAVLEIGGDFESCVLDVDPTTLEASGTCDSILIGIVRPLGLGYWLPDPAAAGRVWLAFLISWVDLRKENLDPGSDTKSVALVGDGVSGEFIHRDSDVTALPDKNAVNIANDEATFNLFEAQRWANLELFPKYGISFDRNTGDKTSNLEEACAGTLFP